MVLFLIGLGLGSPKDITVRGLEAIRSCSQVYLEYYTSIMGSPKQELSVFLGKEVLFADREWCELQIDGWLREISAHPEENYAFLVIGDPFCATTHSDLYLRAVNTGIKVEVIHNASIISAVGCSGLQVYRFGETVSVPLWTSTWQPTSFYPKILQNRKSNLHTLVLLDIKVKERSEENILKGKLIYEKERFMLIHECVEQLLESERREQQQAYDEGTLCLGLARIGLPNQKIKAAKMGAFLKKIEHSEQLEVDMGGPLHSFVICAPTLHSMEKEMFEYFSK